ncbi:MAG: DUF424 family protein [Sulfolobales archaeon]
MSQKDEGERDRFWVKIFRVDSEIVLAICDEDLLGKTLVDQERGIVFTVDPGFYRGELLEIEEIIPLLREATVVNIIGNKIIEKLIEAKIIDDDEENFIYIDGVRHIQIITMK